MSDRSKDLSDFELLRIKIENACIRATGTETPYRESVTLLWGIARAAAVTITTKLDPDIARMLFEIVNKALSGIDYYLARIEGDSSPRFVPVPERPDLYPYQDFDMIPVLARAVEALAPPPAIVRMREAPQQPQRDDRSLLEVMGDSFGSVYVQRSLQSMSLAATRIMRQHLVLSGHTISELVD